MQQEDQVEIKPIIGIVEDSKKEVIPQPEMVAIKDMSLEQLQNAVVNLMDVRTKLEKIVRAYHDNEKKFTDVWGDTKKLKERLRYLRSLQ